MMHSPVLRHVSPRTLRLRIVFSFLLGVVVTATLFSAAWLELGRCAAGEQCTNTGHRLRRVLSVFGAAAVPGSIVAIATAPPFSRGLRQIGLEQQ